jgi:ABC-type transport system involved in multi-copper enzyme maturation permease subunit
VQQFYAILKDSFREAVDGFVIYVMLGLSAIMIILVGSISYSADTGDRAFSDERSAILGRLRFIFPDKGQSSAPTIVPGISYKASDIEDSANHSVSLTLTVTKDENKDQAAAGDLLSGGNAFRLAVFTWLSPPGKKVDFSTMRGKNRNRGGEPELEVVEPARATAEELKAVTDEQMTAFLRYQFSTFVGISESDVTVTRKPGVAEPEFKFDVRLKNLAGAAGWPHQVRLFFGSVGPIRGVPLGASLHFIQDFLVNGIGAAVTLILSVVITAFFIPNMLRKGSLDLLISKPIGRVQLLVYKYIGGLLFIFILSTFTIGGVWLVMAIQSGHWDPRFLLVIPVLTFTFAILYAVSTAVAVLTRSPIAAILVTLAFMLVMYLIGQAKSFIDVNKVVAIADIPEWVNTLVDTLNNILPRYKDLDKLTSRLIGESTYPPGDVRMQGIFEAPSWGGAVGVSLIFIVLMLGLASWRLVKRDG